MEWRNAKINAQGVVEVEINDPAQGWILFSLGQAAQFDVAALAAEIELVGPLPKQTGQLTFAQLISGLVSEGWISKAEGQGWLRGTLPAPVVALIGGLPEAEQIFAEAKAVRPSVILRNDPLVLALAAMQGKTPEQLDTFFNTYGEA
jgi:hypothetical protein